MNTTTRPRVIGYARLSKNPDGTIESVADQRRKMERYAEANGLDVRLVHNPDFAGGMSTSVRTVVAAVPDNVDGAIVCLGDMPQVNALLIDKLLAAFDPEKGAHEASCPMCKFCPACARRVPRNKHNCAEARKEPTK